MTAAKYEHLTCEFPDKPHKWKRELGTRGKKPKFCPKHRPVTQAPGAKELYCVLGKHKWIREPKRGRVPTSCPKHSTTPVIVSAPRNGNGMVSLHCANGNHDWERAPQRGKRPTNCPMHPNTPVGIRTVPVNVIPGSETGDAIPKATRGRPRKYANQEEQNEAKLTASRERAANLISRLKERGTDIQQWQVPYILYKLTDTKPGRGETPPTTTWDKVAEHSPLQMAQFVNANEKAFEDGKFRYEKEGKVINPL